MRLRWLGGTALVALALGGAFVGQANTAGPGGWDHLGDNGTPSGDSLNGVVSVLNADLPAALYVGGNFTDAGGIADADRIASWNGSAWSAVSSPTEQISNGIVMAIAVADGKVYAGGTFQDAGGDANADFLAKWDGDSWEPFCNPTTAQPSFDGNVKALEVVGSTLYVGGDFQNGAGIASADYLVACNLTTGNASSTLADPTKFFSGPVVALGADSEGVLYAGGSFSNLGGYPAVANAADNVAYLAGGVWNAMGSGGGPCGCAIDGFVRSLTVAGTDVYVGTDVKNVAGIQQADNVARWNGTTWSAVGGNTAGDDGWFPSSAFIYALTSMGSNVFAAGDFQNANGDARADNVAFFDGSAWHPLGSDGAGNGPWVGQGHGLAIFPAGGPRQLYAGGSFTSAGGDPQARGVASFALSQVIAQPTPTVTPNPPPAPTPTVTPAPADTTPPTITSLSLSSKAFRAAKSGPAFVAARAGVGAFLSFRLSEAGTVKFTIDRSAAGRAVSGKCVKPTRSNRTRRSCTRWVAAKGSFTVRGKRGANRIKLRGRIGGKTLRPGSYRLNARQTDRARNRSRTKRTAFKIVP
jgi:hypothetical protein